MHEDITEASAYVEALSQNCGADTREVDDIIGGAGHDDTERWVAEMERTLSAGAGTVCEGENVQGFC